MSLAPINPLRRLLLTTAIGAVLLAATSAVSAAE
jgi:hypothetical protein